MPGRLQCVEAFVSTLVVSVCEEVWRFHSFSCVSKSLQLGDLFALLFETVACSHKNICFALYVF